MAQVVFATVATKELVDVADHMVEKVIDRHSLFPVEVSVLRRPLRIRPCKRLKGDRADEVIPDRLRISTANRTRLELNRIAHATPVLGTSHRTPDTRRRRKP